MYSCLYKYNKLNKSHLVGQLLNSIHEHGPMYIEFKYFQLQSTSLELLTNGKVFPVRAAPKVYEGMEVQRHSFLTSELDRFIYLNINQLDALNFMSLFHASTCFEHKSSSSGGQNCTIQHLVSSH